MHLVKFCVQGIAWRACVSANPRGPKVERWRNCKWIFLLTLGNIKTTKNVKRIVLICFNTILPISHQSCLALLGKNPRPILSIESASQKQSMSTSPLKSFRGCARLLTKKMWETLHNRSILRVTGSINKISNLWKHYYLTNERHPSYGGPWSQLVGDHHRWHRNTDTYVYRALESEDTLTVSAEGNWSPVFYSKYSTTLLTAVWT